MDFNCLRPSFWNDSKPVCDVWDKILNDALDKNDVIVKSECIAMVGDLKVWIANYPYSFGHLYDDMYSNIQYMPRPKTRMRLYKIINDMTEKEKREKSEKELAMLVDSYYNKPSTNQEQE